MTNIIHISTIDCTKILLNETVVGLLLGAVELPHGGGDGGVLLHV